MIRHLAESENYKVTSEYEYATLHFKNKLIEKSVYIGNFYGDPDCAIISRDEKYLVVAGCGLIIYRLITPFSEYEDSKKSTQFSEFFGEPENLWWVNGLHQTEIDSDPKWFRFVAANNDGEFIYKMNVDDFSIEKISSSNNKQQAT
jgi:hypothetical protein